MHDPFQTFLAEMAAMFRTEHEAQNRACAALTADALMAASDPGRLTNDAPAHDAAIRRLLAGSPLAVARAALAVQDRLPWGHNPVSSRIAAEDDALFSVVDLLGPDAPIRCDSLRAGLYYQRPGTRYGLHSHAAVETYVIIAGRALWTAGETRRRLGPGAMVHHSTYLPHACRTGPEGVVALWRWSGDIGIDSYRVHSGQGAFGRVRAVAARAA